MYLRESHADPFASTNLPSRSCTKNASPAFSTSLWNRSSLFLRASPRPLRAGRTRPRTACAYAAPATTTRRWPPSQLPQRPLENSLAPCSSRCAGESYSSIPPPTHTDILPAQSANDFIGPVIRLNGHRFAGEFTMIISRFRRAPGENPGESGTDGTISCCERRESSWAAGSGPGTCLP